MNHAARLAAFGDGCVMPKVLMKAFERKSSGFMGLRCDEWGNSIRSGCIRCGWRASRCVWSVQPLPLGRWGTTLNK